MKWWAKGGKGMAYIRGVDRQQKLLLPESLEEYVGAEHPVRFIDAFVEGLDLGACGFGRAVAAATGRPPYAPGDLLKLYLWGYLNRVRSSRGLERECGRNLEVLWLLGKLAPDFKTIADFRKDNAGAFKAVFRQFGLLCRELGLWGVELVAIDGTKLKAVNSASRNHTRAELERWLERIDGQLQEYLQELDRADHRESASHETESAAASFQQKLKQLQTRRREVQAMVEQLEASGARELSRTDADSRRMHKVGVGYNGQIAVDDRHQLIVEAEVLQDKTDYNALLPMAQAACEAMAIDLQQADAPRPTVVADRGYHDRQVLAQVEAAGIPCHVPQPARGHAAFDGHYPKSDFCYQTGSDCYLCPQGAELSRECQTTKHGQLLYLYSNPGACRQCPCKAQCTGSRYRRIERWEKEAVLEKIARRVAANPHVSRRRAALVEHAFGTLKFWWHQGTLLTRGLASVRAEWRLSALAYNLRRVLQIVGVAALLEWLQGNRRQPAPAV
jgi:transposase